MALPAIDALRAALPNASIDVYVGDHSRVVFGFRPDIQTISVPDSFGAAAAFDLTTKLRRKRYDAVINLDRSRWLRVAARMSLAPITVAPESRDYENRHESEVYLDVVRQIGIPVTTTVPSITPSEPSMRQADLILEQLQFPFAVLHPGGAQNPGAQMVDKRWPVEHYSQLAGVIQDHGVGIILSGGFGDIDVARTVAGNAGLAEESNLAGKVGLDVLSGVLSRAVVYVGPDTGVSHIAAAVGTPTIAIFGPTNPSRYRPLGHDVQVLASPGSWSVPERDLRKSNSCSIGPKTDEISVESVVAAALSVLGRITGISACKA